MPDPNAPVPNPALQETKTSSGNLPVFMGLDPSSPIQTAFQMNLDQKDLTSIALTTVQEKIKQEITASAKKIRDLERNKAALLSQMEDLREKWTTIPANLPSGYLDRIAAIQKAMKDWDPSSIFGPTEIAPATIERKTREGVVYFSSRYSFVVRHGTFAGQGFITPFTERAGDAYDALHTAHENVSNDLKVAQQTHLELRACLSNVPAMEARIRAGMALTLANRTESGRELVAAIQNAVNVNDIVEFLKN